MDGVVLFHKLWIIESLPQGDLKTGQNLYDNQIAYSRLHKPYLKVAFEKPHTKKQLLQLLQKVRDEAMDEGLYPMIHFECHGSPSGLYVASGEQVSWNDLRTTLIEINRACRLNLVIVLAACNGAHLIKVVAKLDRAPFWAIISPEVEVTAGDIERDFGAFYAVFLKDFDGDAAITALNENMSDKNRQYHFLTSFGLFLRAYAQYYRDHCIGQGRRNRLENFVSQAMDNPRVNALGVNWVRNKAKEYLSDKEQHFNIIKEKFFFIDLYPDNSQRFPFLYKDVLTKISP